MVLQSIAFSYQILYHVGLSSEIARSVHEPAKNKLVKRKKENPKSPKSHKNSPSPQCTSAQEGRSSQSSSDGLPGPSHSRADRWMYPETWKRPAPSIRFTRNKEVIAR